MRVPLLGLRQGWHHWTGIIAVVGWASTLVIMHNHRSRIPYWV